MAYNSFVLARQAEVEIARIVNGNLNISVHHGGYDILLNKKIRLEIKSATLSEKGWKFTFNLSAGRIREKAHFVICVGYNRNRTKIQRLLCIPTSKLPRWDTSLSSPLTRKNKTRKNWDKYIVEPKELKKCIVDFYKQCNMKPIKKEVW